MAKTNKKTQKIVKKELKKMPSSLKIVAALVFIFASVGAFLTSFMMQKNDCFELIGDQVVTMYIGGSYQEPEVKEAIKCISFGIDATSSVYINEEETTYDPKTSVNNEGTDTGYDFKTLIYTFEDYSKKLKEDIEEIKKLFNDMKNAGIVEEIEDFDF